MTNKHLIRTPEFWNADRVDRQRMYAEYSHVEEASISPVHAYLLGLYALQELDRVEQLVEALALETPQANGNKRPKRKEPVLDVTAADGRIEFMDTKLTPEQARELGSKLLEAADIVEPLIIEGADHGENS